MIDTHNGVIKVSDELTIYPGYSFDQFQHTKFYKNQDGIRIIYLDGQQMIDGRSYIVSLIFRDRKLYMLSLICCDEEFSEQDEKKRKMLHDTILNELGIRPQEQYSWGKISSDYDARGNVSSINIIYF